MESKIKKLKDVLPGDVLYKLGEDNFCSKANENGISEITVNDVTSNYNGDVIFKTTDGSYSPPKSALSNQFFWGPGKTAIGTSKKAVMKASKKMLKKMLEKTDLDIAKLKGRLDNMIEKRKDIYRLYLDTLIS